MKHNVPEPIARWIPSLRMRAEIPEHAEKANITNTDLHRYPTTKVVDIGLRKPIRAIPLQLQVLLDRENCHLAI